MQEQVSHSLFCALFVYVGIETEFFVNFFFPCLVVKGEGKPNDLLERISRDPIFASVHDTLDQLLDPMLFVGRAPEQTSEFLELCVDPILHEHDLDIKLDDVNV